MVLHILYGSEKSTLLRQLYPVGEEYFKPKVGSLLIFPNWLKHAVMFMVRVKKDFGANANIISPECLIGKMQPKKTDKNTHTLEEVEFVMVEAEEVLVQRQKIDYKYNEDNILKELQEYIDKTYDEHYSHKNFQATEFVIDSGHGEGFCIGNIMKYAQRYGKKNGKDRKDLLKVIHYGIMALYNH